MHPKHQRGFLKTGDLFLPGGDGFPSFSKLGALAHVDEILDSLPEKDRLDLLRLMGVFGRTPSWLIRFVLSIARRHRFFPGPVGTALRLLDFGLKGIFFTLYYSEESVFTLIYWDAKTVA